MAIRIQKAASIRLDEIHHYTRDQWGEAQADAYIRDLFKAFERLETNGVRSKPIPAEFGVSGYYFRHQRHFIYWKFLKSGDIGIVTILHERMHQLAQFKDVSAL